MVEEVEDGELPFMRGVRRLGGLELLGSAARGAAVQWSALVLVVVGVVLFLADVVLQVFAAPAWPVVGGAGLAACGLAQRLTRGPAPPAEPAVRGGAGAGGPGAPPRRAGG